jgi:Zn-dependent M32 family carboxypeptidase
MEKRNLPADYISPEVLLHEACHNVQFRSCPVELIGTMACAIDSQDFIVSEGFATYCESLTENLGFMSRIHEAAKQAFPDYVRQSGSVVDVVKQSGFAGFRGAYKTSVHQINAVVAQLERAFFSGQITGDQFFDQVSALANSYYGYPSGYPSAAVVFIHWHIGLWAYLSGYDLGLYGWKQIANYAIANNTDIAAAVEQGDFRPLMDWMHNGPLANMHKYNIEQMVKVYTGKDYSPDDYVWSMEQFYAQMTGLQVAKSPAYVPATSTQQYSSSQDQAIAFAKYSAMVGKVAAATDNKHLTDYLAADTVGHLDMPIVPMPDASSLNITLIESS